MACRIGRAGHPGRNDECAAGGDGGQRIGAGRAGAGRAVMGLGLSRRTRIAIIALFAMGFVIFLPMRIALGMAGLERLGVAAREVRGTVWSGRSEEHTSELQSLMRNSYAVF